MPCMYFDESIHDQSGFILGALLYADDSIDDKVRSGLAIAGLNPETDEFKSGAHMARDVRLQIARDTLLALLWDVKIGLTIVECHDRKRLWLSLLCLLDKVIRNNDVALPVCLYVDQGIVTNLSAFQSRIEGYPWGKQVIAACQCDSRRVPGIQFADLIASFCSTMLKEAIGVPQKKVLVKDYPSRGEDMMIELGWTLWATLRYRFFQGEAGVSEESQMNGYTNISNYGLFADMVQDKRLADAIDRRFSGNYLGCIH
jgi:hypothetical protein